MRAWAEHVGRAPLAPREARIEGGAALSSGRGPLRAGGAIALMSALLCLWSAAWAGDEIPPQKKKFPHPHAVHLEIVEQSTPEFAIEEITNWAEFFRSFQTKLELFSLAAEVRRLVSRAQPETLSADEKAIVVSELNRLLRQPNAGIRGRQAAPASAETAKAAARYRKSRAPDDLTWVHRNLIGDVFPQVARKGRDSELPPITCVTCHEGHAVADKGLVEGLAAAPDADERAVAECFARAVTEGQSTRECLAKADALRAARIQAPGPLRGIIQKRLPEGDTPLLAAVRPEDPYTFKPLLKRLACTQCHAHGRTVDRVKGRQGEMKGIPLFYGEGFRQIRPEDVADVQAR